MYLVQRFPLIDGVEYLRLLLLIWKGHGKDLALILDIHISWGVRLVGSAPFS